MAAIQREFTIPNKSGLHARPAALFVRLASQCRSEIWVETGGEQVNGKSIMGLMVLGLGQGDTLRINVDGEDAEEAMENIAALIESGFREL